MSSHWVRLERVSWVRPTATTLVTAKRPYAARVARLFDEGLTLWILPRAEAATTARAEANERARSTSSLTTSPHGLADRPGAGWDRSSAIGVATVNHRDDLDDEAVFEDPVEDAVLASPC